MDPLVLVIVVVVGTPIAVVFALAKSAQLRGPGLGKESRRPVETMVTDAVPEEHPDNPDVDESARERGRPGRGES